MGVDAWTGSWRGSEALATSAGLAESRGDRRAAAGLYAEAARMAEAALGTFPACGPGLYAETLARAAWLWLRAGQHDRMFELVGSAFSSPALPAHARASIRETLMRSRPAGTAH